MVCTVWVALSAKSCGAQIWTFINPLLWIHSCQKKCSISSSIFRINKLFFNLYISSERISVVGKFLHFTAAPSILQIKKKNHCFSLRYICRTELMQNWKGVTCYQSYLCRAPKQQAQEAFHCTCAQCCNTSLCWQRQDRVCINCLY